MVWTLADLGDTPLRFTPAEFGRMVADQTETWAKVVQGSGAKREEV